MKKNLYHGAVAAAALGLLYTSVATGKTPSITAAHAKTGSIMLDGRLDESAWRHARTIRLTQQDPHPGAPTPYRTTVRVLTDAQHIYFGIVCTDPNPDAIAVHTLRRDGDQTNDDHFTIVLDPFDGGRLGYWFQVNVDGARTDGLDTNDDTSSDWDGIWNAKTHRTRTGWTAEIAISTRSLQFPSVSSAWKLNFERYIPRKQLTLRWSGITLDSDVFDLHRAGFLYGLGDLKQGHGVTVQPYVLGRYNSAPGTGRSGDIGADIKYDFTPQMEGILTINPDFAEAEAEKGQINLTRFPIFFPEKRPFFLEGSNLFKFGYALDLGNDNNLSTQFVPFFSRRIGLVDGKIVPIDTGAKLIGHSGRFSIGALDVEAGNGAGVSATNLAVGRSTYDVGNNLRIGTLLTHGDPTGLTNNSFVGVDSLWHTSHFDGDKNLTLSGWYGHSYDNPQAGAASGYGGAVAYLNDLWFARFKANQFDKALYPALGYLPRPGTRQYLGTVVYRPRPERDLFDWVRQFNIGATYIQVDALDGQPQSKLLMAVPFGIKTKSGYSIQPEFNAEYEALDKPFTVAPNVTIPAGQYRFNQYLFFGSTPKSLPWVISANIVTGDFYTGTLKTESISADWSSPGGHLQLGISNENDFGYLPQGNFIIRLTQLNAIWSFTPNLALSTFAQYDSINRKTGANLRLQWIIRPGRELFVVFNHGIEPQLANLNRAPPTGNVFIVKLRWNFIL